MSASPRFVLPDLCDQYSEQMQIAAPVFRHFGGRRIFSCPILTISCFEDNSLVADRVRESGTGAVLVVDGGAMKDVDYSGGETLKQVVNELQARGVRLGVLTRNTRSTALRSLAVAGLAGFFDAAHVVGRHEATPKPDPEGLWLLLRAWSVPPERALMVGDAPHDTDTGLAIGAFAVGVDPHQRRSFGAAHAVVADLAALGAILAIPL